MAQSEQQARHDDHAAARKPIAQPVEQVAAEEELLAHRLHHRQRQQDQRWGQALKRPQHLLGGLELAAFQGRHAEESADQEQFIGKGPQGAAEQRRARARQQRRAAQPETGGQADALCCREHQRAARKDDHAHAGVQDQLNADRARVPRGQIAQQKITGEHAGQTGHRCGRSRGAARHDRPAQQVGPAAPAGVKQRVVAKHLGRQEQRPDGIDGSRHDGQRRHHRCRVGFQQVARQQHDIDQRRDGEQAGQLQARHQTQQAG